MCFLKTTENDGLHYAQYNTNIDAQGVGNCEII